MPTIERTCLESVFSRYWRAVIHMRQQIAFKRFGLVLGAGVSRDFGFPDWKELIKSIAGHSEVNGTELLGKRGGNTSQSQLLFQHYRASQLANASPEDMKLNRIEAKVLANWHKIVHDVLYENVPSDNGALLQRDVYLRPFLSIIKQTPLTINYNFDNTLQRMLTETRTPEEKKWPAIENLIQML